MLITEVTELEIEMSTLCNAKCPLCYRNYKSFPEEYKKPVIRKFEDLCNQLNEYTNLNYVMIVGSMSEPTLYPYFLDVVAYLKKRNIRIEICTNGSTHSTEFWKELGKLLSTEDAVYFTICGSTQEIHEKYRVGTILQNILDNAKALRTIIPIDYAQCIRFSYNSNDFETEEFKNIINEFSNVYMTETFYPKNIENYNTKFDISLFIPNKLKIEKYNKVKTIAECYYSRNAGKLKAQCQSYNHKRQQIDVFGNVYPCYLFLEYSNLKKWNGDYSEILSIEHDCCKYCEKSVYEYCVKNKLDYII